MLIAISQSGETADTLAAVREGKRRGAGTLVICNVVESSLAREADGVIYTHAGPEIGVASTKAFATQLVVLFLFALRLGRDSRPPLGGKGKTLLEALLKIPHLIEVLLKSSKQVARLRGVHLARDFLYLGRGINYPIALEGALKLKEISYIHAEGYPAGEMKHGPIALIDRRCRLLFWPPGTRFMIRSFPTSRRSGQRGKGHCPRLPVGSGSHAKGGRRDLHSRDPAFPHPHSSHHSASASGLLYGGLQRDRCRSAKESGQKRHGGVRRVLSQHQEAPPFCVHRSDDLKQLSFHNTQSSCLEEVFSCSPISDFQSRRRSSALPCAILSLSAGLTGSCSRNWRASDIEP